MRIVGLWFRRHLMPTSQIYLISSISQSSDKFLEIFFTIVAFQYILRRDKENEQEEIS